MEFIGISDALPSSGGIFCQLGLYGFFNSLPYNLVIVWVSVAEIPSRIDRMVLGKNGQKN